jgi:hypothetical protein
MSSFNKGIGVNKRKLAVSFTAKSRIYASGHLAFLGGCPAFRHVKERTPEDAEGARSAPVQTLFLGGFHV